MMMLSLVTLMKMLWVGLPVVPACKVAIYAYSQGFSETRNGLLMACSGDAKALLDGSTRESSPDQGDSRKNPNFTGRLFDPTF